ncbi:MAG: hypothetical protein K5672_05965 [Bacteroidaceae bacterium]|jgi:hypothetical protein|nr:hypothetical protein [Bacteroidaceae bacterium]
MGNLEDDFLADAEDDRLTVEFIKNYLPQEVKEKFTEDDLYYFLDVIGEYYVDLLEKTKSEDEVDIDIDAVAQHIAKKAKQEKMGDFDPEDLRWVVDGELEYGESLEN